MRFGWRPDTQGQLLLDAALGGASVAPAAWDTWHGRSDLAAANRGALRLLPLIDANLRACGIDDGIGEPASARLLPMWCDTQLLFHETRGALGTLRDAGIPTLLLKGAASAHLDYPDSALRPMADVDVGVPRRDAARALGLLTAHGWSCAHPLSTDVLAFQDGATFTNGAGGRLDLHWRLLRQGRFLHDDDQSLWREAIPMTFEGVPTQALSAADRLLQACVHGTQWHGTTLPIRWAVDAAMILRAHGTTLAWDHLMDEAGRRHLAPVVADAFDVLVSRTHAPVPEAVIAQLRRTETPRLSRIVNQLRTRHEGAYAAGWQNWSAGWRLCEEPTTLRRLGAFLRYFRATRRIDHAWQAPPRILSAVFRAAGRALVRATDRRRDASRTSG